MTTKLLLKILLKPKMILWEIISLLLQLIANGISVAVPIMASVALDQFFNLGHIDNNEIIILISLMLSTLIIPPVSSWLNMYLWENIGLELKNLLLEKLLRLSPADLLKNDQGKIYTVFTNDIGVVKDTLIRTIPSLITSIILFCQKVEGFL